MSQHLDTVLFLEHNGPWCGFQAAEMRSLARRSRHKFEVKLATSKLHGDLCDGQFRTSGGVLQAGAPLGDGTSPLEDGKCICWVPAWTAK